MTPNPKSTPSLQVGAGRRGGVGQSVDSALRLGGLRGREQTHAPPHGAGRCARCRQKMRRWVRPGEHMVALRLENFNLY
jgi:hypothetical protein